MSLKKNTVNASQVQSTNDSSIVSKCSMVKRNYVADEFVKHFVEKEKNRASLIHLGYYTRAVTLSSILVKFIEYLRSQEFIQFQIISCGSGFDTSYWRLTSNGLLNENSLFIEIDYPNVIKRKVFYIKQSEKLRSYVNISEIDDKTNKLNSNYFLLSADLCDLRTIEELFQRINVNFNIPSLFLSECVVTYMKEQDSNNLMKWITEKFVNCAFINYEQIHPEDGFGQIMMQHFNKLQSPLHSVLTYPDCESHRDRYRALGFQESVVWSEWDCLLLLTSDDERRRVLTLEQFDEFEEFHLKCSHYVLAIAANNFMSDWPKQTYLNEPVPGLDGHYGVFPNFCIEETDEPFELFGHVSCRVENDIFIFGGFGTKGRSKDVHVFHNGHMKEVQASGDHSIRYDFIHGSAVSFQLAGKSYIGLYGGRTSPNNVNNNGDLVLMECSGEKLLARRFNLDKDNFVPRYRNSMVCHPYGTHAVSAWIFGGRTPDLKQCLSDLWQIIIQTGNERELSLKVTRKGTKNSGPCGRMSHSAAVTNDAMYIICGLETHNFTVLNDIWKWTFETETWEEIQPRTMLLPRYCHTSHIHENFLYLLGGVNTYNGRQPGLAVINMDTLYVTEYSMEFYRVEPVLFFNHSSIITWDNKNGPIILVIGGGGNCFSFGTYFNKHLYVVPLKQFRSS